MVKDHSAREETHCCHRGYSFRLTARVLLYASSHRQDSTYHGLCYTSRGALAGTRNRQEEGMFYLMTHSTHFIYDYMVMEHLDSERGNLLQSPYRVLFPSTKGSYIYIYIYIYHFTDRIVHTTAFVKPVVED